MKVIKSILIAVVLGIVYVGIGLMKIDNIKMSERVCEIKSVNRHSMISDGAVSS